MLVIIMLKVRLSASGIRTPSVPYQLVSQREVQLTKADKIKFSVTCIHFV